MTTRSEHIALGLADVRARIADAERAAGRSAGTVRLIAVSKKMPPEDIETARAQGQLDFGENYAQELRDKRAILNGRAIAGERAGERAGAPDLRWHYLGPLQSNKVKYVAGLVSLIHSVDSPEIVREIDRRAGAAGVDASGGPQGCLVQVNVAGETRKGGVAPAELSAVLDQFTICPHAACVGLMVIPPFTERPEDGRRHFAALLALAERERRIARPNVDLRELSMGMSQDFAEAIAEGATLVRIGTAIFGARAA